MYEDFFQKLEDMGAEIQDTKERMLDNEEMYVKFLRLFSEDENLELLKKAVAEQDYQEASERVHAIKGVALNLGLLPIADICMDMMLEFRQNNPQKALESYPKLEKCIKMWIQVIQTAEG